MSPPLPPHQEVRSNAFKTNSTNQESLKPSNKTNLLISQPAVALLVLFIERHKPEGEEMVKENTERNNKRK